MMHTLAKVGFQQSLHLLHVAQQRVTTCASTSTELSGDAAAYMRPSFWPTTHDILTPYMQFGGPAAWKLRAVLAATLVPTYGIYAGYELMEHVARPGVEEQIDNEKYEYKDRHWADYEPGGSKAGQLAGRLPHHDQRDPRARTRRCTGCATSTSTTSTTRTSSRFSKRRRLPDGTRRRRRRRRQPRPALHPRHHAAPRHGARSGLEPSDTFEAHDVVTDERWTWQRDNYVRLGPEVEPVHVVAVRRPW